MLWLQLMLLLLQPRFIRPTPPPISGDLQLNVLHTHGTQRFCLQLHVETLDVNVQSLLGREHLRALAALILLHHMVAKDVLRALGPAGKCERTVWTVEWRHRRMQIDDMSAVLQAAGESRSVVAEATLER